MPTKDKADFMFVQHMVASLNNVGRMAVVMPTACCIGAGKKKFRAHLLSRGYLEACYRILPSALFYGTPVLVLVSCYQ